MSETATERKPRQSRASKAAAKAAQEAAEREALALAEAGDIEPSAEAVEKAADLIIREAAASQVEISEPDETQEPEQPKPDLVDLNPYAYTLHRPKVTGPDGVVHECPHKWGHEEEKVAWVCARRVAREAGLDDSGMYQA